MKRIIHHSPASLFLLVVLLCLVMPAYADSLSGSFDGVATLTPTGTPGIFIQNFVGDGTDVTFGAFTAMSQSTVDFSSPPNIIITNAMLTEMFAGGTLFGTGSGTGTASGQGTATFTAQFLITGGTGIFEHQTGQATIVGTITQTSPTTEAIEATYTGILGVPEPASVSLLFLGATMGYRLLKKPAI
jgi:hypothetical protein